MDKNIQLTFFQLQSDGSWAGVTYVENATGFGDTIAKATPTLYTHDAKANRFFKIKITEDDVAITVVTLSVAIR